MDDSHKIEALEIKVAYLEDTVERLDGVIVMLRSELDALCLDFKRLRLEGKEGEPEVRESEPPPHY